MVYMAVMLEWQCSDGGTLSPLGHEWGDSSVEFKKNGLLDFGCLVVRATVARADLPVCFTVCLFISPDVDG